MALTTAKAIRAYLAPVTARELVDFKTVCTPEEWETFGKDAAAALGEEWEAPKV